MRKIFVLISLVMALSVITSAFAATVTVRPDGQGFRKGWGNVGCGSGSNEYQCVDEVTLDTSDYLRTSGTKKESFTFANTGLTDETINSVTMHYVAMRHNNNKNRCFEAMTRSGGTDHLAGTQLCVSSTWEEVTHSYTTNPATGSAWTVSEVDALEAGMHGLNPNGGGRVAQVWAVVDYTVPDLQPIASAFAFPTSGTAPLTVNFTGSVTSGDPPFTYFWDFMDGANSTLQSPLHTFTVANTYNVSFTVTDNDNDQDTDFVVITVNPAQVCGNNIREGTEVCDGTDLDGETCSSQGFDGGTLACQSDCTGFDTSSCFTNVCSDTDGGINAATQGTVSGSFAGQPFSHTDFCIPTNETDPTPRVEEYYCSGVIPFSTEQNCLALNFTGCSNGACI